MKLLALLSLFTVTLHISKAHHNLDGTEQIGLVTCTGVFISQTDLLTAGHCMEHSRGHQWILTTEGKSYPAELLAIDHFRDLALIQVTNLPPHKYALLGNEVHRTQEVYTLNSQDGFPGTYNQGIVMNVLPVEDDACMSIFHSALITHGASGSGLFSKDGKLVGINNLTAPGYAVAVDLSEIKHFLNLYHEHNSN